ncbi:MAG: hypothetical protein PHU64_03425 [Candidatus Omnitrophica bacterium]|nr:hypothetical protein [Candidatus Omnitrophota bacterium]MDD5430017.1 hypothetical protein [Candidatus Omnitrophota bacterium]
MEISDQAFFKFVKKYPRMSLLGFCLILGLLLIIPISFKDKVLVILRAFILGLGISVAWYFLRGKRKHD